MSKDQKPTLAEMRKRPEFQESLDLRVYPVVELKIIARYVEPELVPCGMPGQHLHKKGCFVQAPDGLITIIGHMCARTYLGTEWNLVDRKFRDRERDTITFETVEAFLARSQEHLARATELWDGERGGWWLSRCQRQLERLPVWEELREMFRSGNGRIYDHTARAYDPWNLASLGYGKGAAAQPVKGEIAALDGGRAVVLLHVQTDLLEPLKRYTRHSSPDEMKNAERRACARFCGSLEQEFLRAERVVNEGRRFFTEANFLEIAKIRDYLSRAVMTVWRDIAALPLEPSGGKSRSS